MKRFLHFFSIRSDHGNEFENAEFRSFCEKNGIFHNFSSTRTPRQNGVVERKNKTLKEIARTMLCENSLPKHFWTEAVNVACYVQNKILIKKILLSNYGEEEDPTFHTSIHLD